MLPILSGKFAPFSQPGFVPPLHILFKAPRDDALEAGQVHPEPVQTRYGVHVVKLDRKICGESLPFDQVHERIAAYLEVCSWRRAVAQYVALLAGQAQITGFDLPGAPSLLVQ